MLKRSTLQRKVGLARSAWKKKPTRVSIKPKAKRKAPSLGKLKKKLWTLVSIYVRRSAAMQNGYTECYTCSRWMHWKELQAGHFVNKSFGLAAYFDIRNIRVQCESCNIWKEGNKSAYALRLLKEHGQEYLEDLERLKWVQTRDFPYEEEIAKYENLIANLSQTL